MHFVDILLEFSPLKLLSFPLISSIFYDMQQQGFCYGFVEFEVAIAVQSAIEVLCISLLELSSPAL